MKMAVPIALALLLSACSQDNNSSTEKVKSTQEVTDKQIENQVPKQVEATEIKKAVEEEVKAVIIIRTGQDIYRTCSACHGQNAEKVALGKSKVIRGWDISKSIDALNGYKNGTYGGAMKGLMKGQVSNLSDDEIKQVSEYISKL